jgi:hypothetical protein
MNSTKVDPLISMNTPLTKIIISKPNAQQTLINILDIQMDPLVNPFYNVMCLFLMTRPSKVEYISKYVYNFDIMCTFAFDKKILHIMS